MPRNMHFLPSQYLVIGQSQMFLLSVVGHEHPVAEVVLHTNPSDVSHSKSTVLHDMAYVLKGTKLKKNDI